MKSENQVDRAALHSGDIVDRRYKIKKVLGEGAFGAVYLVDDLSQNRPFALKIQRLWEVMDDSRQMLRDRFHEEYETGRIRCECLVNSLAHGTINGNPYLVMEYCPGGDLTPLLGKAGDRAVSICHDILVGLNALHSHGKVHRDLKPENVLFKESGRAALTDFGIVGDRTNNLTAKDWRNRPKDIFGTHAYMAPEQRGRVKGATKLPTTDIFSFGVLTYQLVTGYLPFGPLDTWDDLKPYTERAEKGQWDDRPLLQIEHGAYWRRLIDACLRTDYTQRLRSAAAADKLLPPIKELHSSSRIPLTTSYKPAAVTCGFQLRVLDGGDFNRVYDLNVRRQGRTVTLFTIGRHSSNDICLRNANVNYLSRYHCTLESDRQTRQWRILDGQWQADSRQWVKSRNGTYVNSTPVGANGFYLKPGDIITIGEVTLRFENY